jgi:site-specific DNA-methyltransferase (adenine-specific)
MALKHRKARSPIEGPPVRIGDNMRLMFALPDACADLIYADPPFYTGRQRERGPLKHGFGDRWPGGIGAYLAFLEPRFREMHRLLKPTGTIYVHLDWHAVHYVKVLLDGIFGYDQFLNEIVWSYRTGGLSSRWFARKHDTILAYARCRGRHTFHVLRDGRFRTDGMNHDEAGRPYKSTRNGRLYFHPDGPAMTDVWDIPFLSTVSRERTGYPSQKPLALLERIIRASSNPGDLVADFFCGSGTTLVAAKRLGRRYFGCDSSAAAAATARQRLAETPAAKQPTACSRGNTHHGER